MMHGHMQALVHAEAAKPVRGAVPRARTAEPSDPAHQQLQPRLCTLGGRMLKTARPRRSKVGLLGTSRLCLNVHTA